MRKRKLPRNTTGASVPQVRPARADYSRKAREILEGNPDLTPSQVSQKVIAAGLLPVGRDFQWLTVQIGKIKGRQKKRDRLDQPATPSAKLPGEATPETPEPLSKTLGLELPARVIDNRIVTPTTPEPIKLRPLTGSSLTGHAVHPAGIAQLAQEAKQLGDLEALPLILEVATRSGGVRMLREVLEAAGQVGLERLTEMVRVLGKLGVAQ